MNPDRKKLIIGRLLREIEGLSRVALGPGVPQEVVPYLPDQLEWLDLSKNSESTSTHVDLVAVEALEISEKGEIVLPRNTVINGLEADRWIVTVPIQRDDGNLRLVKQCRLPAPHKKRAELIFTELGVIGINEVGFELKELSPGASSDDVRMKVQASLHVADGIERLKI